MHRLASIRCALAASVLAASALATSALWGQYPVAPAPVVDVSALAPELKLSGYVSARATRRNDTTTTAINRARLTLVARPSQRVGIRIQGDFANRGRVASDSSVSSFALADAYVVLALPERAPFVYFAPSVAVGQFRVPFSLEYLTPFSLLATADRSLPVDSISPRRDIGALAQLYLTPLIRITGALVNGGGANNPRNSDGKQLASGRLSLIVPLRSLPLSVSGKWAGEGADHRWGYDARVLPGRAILEGEALQRSRRTPTTREVTSGAYALAA
jgi:phosphate-selective porin